MEPVYFAAGLAAGVLLGMFLGIYISRQKDDSDQPMKNQLVL